MGFLGHFRAFLDVQTFARRHDKTPENSGVSAFLGHLPGGAEGGT